MTHEQLQVFKMAAETLNFSEAARRLHLSQPTVSQQIKVLERQLGVELFERAAREVRLTPAGSVLYPYAVRVHQELEAARQAMGSLHGTVAGPLRIGASTSIGNYWLPDVLAAFKSAHPEAAPTLAIENSARLLEWVTRGSLDMLMVEGNRPAIADQRLTVERFMMDRLVLIASPALVSEPGASIHELARLPWIVREVGSGTREVVCAHLKQRGVDPEAIEIALELGSTEAIKRAVASGIGIACVSAWAIPEALKAGHLHVLEVEGWNLERPLWLVRPHARYLSLVGRTFLDHLAERRSTSGEG